jgi:hypothetical protein
VLLHAKLYAQDTNPASSPSLAYFNLSDPNDTDGERSDETQIALARLCDISGPKTQTTAAGVFESYHSSNVEGKYGTGAMHEDHDQHDQDVHENACQRVLDGK